MDLDKQSIRDMIWRRMMDLNIARPPYPIRGRIPNFHGAVEAARRLLKISEFYNARVVKVNPDSPQKPVRELVLKLGKKLIMPTPRLKKGFLLIDPDRLNPGEIGYASTIRGAFRYGYLIHPSSMPRIDFIVEGSVAVSRDCGRLGKGEGYGELEYAILLEYGVIDRDIPIATTVHDIQVLDRLPQDIHDVSINYIVTPTRVIKCNVFRRPEGIIWSSLELDKIYEIPLLKELSERRFI